MTDLNIPTAEAFRVLEAPSRYKGVWGGRGSGKSHHMAGAIVEHCLLNPGARIEALGFYHEKKDEQRSVGLGPSHDWSSHAADAFGLMALRYEDPVRVARFNRKIVYPQVGII